VTSIGNEAFLHCSDELIIHTPAGSYAERYAEENHIRIKILQPLM
jgi:hypothetical protein